MITSKLLQIQKQDIALKKDGRNPHFKSKYLTLDSIIEVYSPLLSNEGIVIYHNTKDSILTTHIIDTEDNSEIISEFAILNTDPQKRGGEITYGKRYNLGSLLNIMTEEDDDGNRASGNSFQPRSKFTWGTIKATYEKDDDWLTIEDYAMRMEIEDNIDSLKIDFEKALALCNESQIDWITGVKDKAKKRLSNPILYV